MPKKLDYTYIKQKFAERGAVLLSVEYINSYSKLDYMCAVGHYHSISWDNWKQRHACPKCANNIKLDIKYIREEFKKEGYTLLSNMYVNNKEKLKCECPVGHIFEISWGKWRYRRRCKKCADLAISGTNHYMWRGGISFEPYCPVWKDKEFKADIKERDSNICLNPYCCSNNPNDLVIHHIDYNKKNCHPSNLITVCRACNNRANVDRGWHESWYKAIINKRYKCREIG